jgi:hypothetical protein
VRQGDPLSPILYILAMDSFHTILQWAADHDLLADLGLHHNVPRASIYADDAVIFFRPLLQDMEVIAAALRLFAGTSGLHVNLQKSCPKKIYRKVAKKRIYRKVPPLASAAPRIQHFSYINKEFPITYLGLPLATGKLRRAEIWPLIYKYSAKFKGWKPRFLRTSGRLQLTKSVLMALPNGL